MRRIFIILVLLGLESAFAMDWDAILASRLGSNLKYREAVLKLRKAELRAAQLGDTYIPYLSLGTAGQQGAVVFKDGRFQPVTLRGSASFPGFLGTDILISLPATIGSDPGGKGVADPFSLGSPSVTVSRRLFRENDVELLASRSALIRAEGEVLQAEADALLQLVTEILSARHSVLLLNSYRSGTLVRERLMNATRNPASQREVQRALLTARKELLSAETTISTMPDDLRGDLTALYEEVLRISASWFEAFPSDRRLPGSSPEVRARELDLLAAEKQRSQWFLPYLPDPTVSAGLSYDPNSRAFSWSLSFQFSADILDRGERAVDSLERRESADIVRLRLASERTGLEDRGRAAWTRLDILELDRQIHALDIGERRETLERRRALHAAGFATEEDLLLAELDLSTVELRALQTEHDLLVQKVRIMQLLSADRENRAQ